MPYVTGFERRAMKRGERLGEQRGEQRGEKRGEKRGEQRGAASVLKRLLTRRFEQLPAWAEERLENASRDEIEHWADRVIDAESLEQVFAAS